RAAFTARPTGGNGVTHQQMASLSRTTAARHFGKFGRRSEKVRPPQSAAQLGFGGRFSNHSERSIEEYRAYVIGFHGHIIKRIDIRCPDEKEARRLAKIAVDGHA